MDTITHFVLGGCVGEIVSGKGLGKKSIIIGGLAQLIPDIDFLFGLWMTPASNALAHRGVTHSILFLSLITPILAWCMQRWRSKESKSFGFWVKIVGIQILIHLLLDAFNAYGTGWFEPFSHFRISFNTLFVADPLFSLPLGVSMLFLLIIRSDDAKRRLISRAAVITCILYAGYAGVNKSIVSRQVVAALKNEHLPSDQYFTTPTPFNSFLWYIVSTDSTGSYVAHRSVFDHDDNVQFQFFPRNQSLLASVNDRDELDKLIHLSQGHFTVAQQNDTLVFNDLRFGQMLGWEHARGGFVFHYYLSPPLDNTLVLQRGRFAGWNTASIQRFIRRMFGGSISNSELSLSSPYSVSCEWDAPG